MSVTRMHGWRVAPRVGVVDPGRPSPGWSDTAWWCALLEAWGLPFERTSPDALGATAWTTLVVPAALVDDAVGAALRDARVSAVLLVGRPTQAAARLDTRAAVTRFETSAEELSASTCEASVEAAERALLATAPDGLVSVWRWPGGAVAALVVDGDVDHPTGVDPECARYVAPAIETARRAGFDAYGIFAAAANVDAEPASFPPGAEYYNHSYSHPYSHWNDAPWEALDAERMREEITRSDETFRSRLGTDDHRVFRLPHFQLEACDRTYDVLEDLGYLAESSIGGNVSPTGGLPFHPARRPWSDRPADAAFARTDPEPSERRPMLQLPISTDPTDTAFPNGCCSYNTLGEGVRGRTADPAAYESVLHRVLDDAVRRRGLAHLFIDPPDAGFGRFPGDRPDYASAVERWHAAAVARDDLAILSTAGLARWWLDRERAVAGLGLRVDAGALAVDAPDVADLAIAVVPPGERGWRIERAATAVR